MVEEAARDYAQYLCRVNLENELKPLNANIEEMLTRIEEFQSLLSAVKSCSDETIKDYLPQILEYSINCKIIFSNIEDLEKFIEIVNKNLDELEEVVEIAEEELQISDNSLKGFLKPIFGKTRSKSPSRTNVNSNGDFKKPEIFETSKYFTAEES